MVDIIRPNFGTVWAASGEKLSPTEIKLQGGWIQELMPYQYQNFLQNRVDNAITYLLQKGVPEWDAAQEYTANKSVVTYSGQLYMAITTNTNVLPSVVASWKRLTITFGTNGAIPVSFGGTGATNAVDARVNLGIGTSATADFPVANGLISKLADNTLVARTIIGTAGYISVTNGDGVSGNPTINVGANVAKTDADAAWTTTSSIRLPAGSTAQRGVGAPGRIRFNLESGVYEGYDNTGWNPIGSTGTLDVQNFSGDGVKTSFTMSTTPRAENNTQVYFNGVYQQKNSYNLVGSNLVFDESPALGIEIEVVTVSSVAIGTTTAAQTSIVDSGNYFSSGSVEGALQEVGLKASFVKDAILSYPDYAAASAAATTLPDGQIVEVMSDESRDGSTSRYIVETNQLVFISSSSSSGEQSFTQTGEGAILQTVSEKLQQTPTAKDFGVVADRVANDTLPISNAVARIGGVKPVAEVTAYTNDTYAPLTDVIVEMGSAVMNPQHDRTARVFGEEYLQAFHLKFSGENGINTSNVVEGKTIVYSGDSTVLGVGANLYRDPCTLLKYSAYGAGYAGVTVLNRGQSGKATVDWDSTFVASDIAANPDLLVLRWGVNDPYYGYTIDQFRAALRSGLTKVRAARTISQTSVVLMTPCSTNDKATGRDEVWHERINGIIRQAARDFQCTFVDTYAYLQDSHNGAAYMDTQANGSHVHPLDVLYEKINRILADVIFPTHYIYGRSNNFHNLDSAVSPNPLGSDDPAVRQNGLTYERNGGSSAINGQLITLRGPNQTAIQITHALPGITSGKGLRARTWFNGTNLAGWLGASTGVTFANGWADFGLGYSGGRVQSTLDGRAGLFGLIKPGTTAAGTKLFSVPAWLAPISDELIKVHGELGDLFIRVEPNGDVIIPLPAASVGAYISLNGASWLLDGGSN